MPLILLFLLLASQQQQQQQHRLFLSSSLSAVYIMPCLLRCFLSLSPQMTIYTSCVPACRFVAKVSDAHSRGWTH